MAKKFANILGLSNVFEYNSATNTYRTDLIVNKIKNEVDYNTICFIKANSSDINRKISNYTIKENDTFIVSQKEVFAINPKDGFSPKITAGTNISINNGVISANGYTYNPSNYSFAEGFRTIASGQASHAEGAKYADNRSTESAGMASHAEGASTYSKADGSHAEGILNIAGRSLDEISTAAQELGISGTQQELAAKLLGYGAHVEGMNNKALGSCSHAEGQATNALANSTHAEGDTTLAFGEASHAEGYNTQAKGNQSHAEGSNTIATGNSSHAEGVSTVASGSFSHAEGSNTEAIGRDSHAEGAYNKANGTASHAEGDHTIAYGFASHTEGEYTITHNSGEHAEGRYNLSNHDSTDRTEYATISSIGIGSDDNNRANAVEVMLNGDVYIKGIGGYDGTNPSETKTLQDVINSGNNTNVDYLPLSGGNMESTINFPWGDENTTPYIIFGSGSVKPYDAYGVNIDVDNTNIYITNGLVETDGYVQALGFYDTSDIRKKDVQGELSLDKAYDFIRNCEPILYNLKGSDKTQIGLIAQEVREFFPEIVKEDKDGYLSLDYTKLTVIILRVLKDLIDK